NEINKNAKKFKAPYWWFVASVRFIAPVLLAGLFAWNIIHLIFVEGGNYGGYPMWAIICGGWVVSAFVFASGFIAKIIIAKKKKDGFVEDEVVWED
ncbi:MAG: hypothetical protein IIZ23_01965, partial [Ruminococcus sp.]|nr:hypothetical protein [Ruminococcus sp.]